MAKKTNGTTPVVDQPTPAAAAAPVTEERKASKPTLRLIEQVRAQFTPYLEGYNALQATRTKLAPLFMRAFNTWAGETGGSFVAYVRLFDTTVPMQSEGYRNHSTYQAAEYLRRKARDLAAVETEGEAVAAAPGVGIGAESPATPLDVLARFVAMMLPLIAHEDQPKVWAFFATEAHWSERRITALRELVEQVKPFATVRTERGQTRPQLHLVAPHGSRKTGTTG